MGETFWVWIDYLEVAMRYGGSIVGGIKEAHDEIEAKKKQREQGTVGNAVTQVMQQYSEDANAPPQ